VLDGTLWMYLLKIILVGNLKGRYHLGDKILSERIILRQMLKK
jgi:hypothetical protein